VWPQYGEGLRHGVAQRRTACRHSSRACGEPVDSRLECNRHGDRQRSWDCDAPHRDEHGKSTGQPHDSGHRDLDAGTNRDNGTDVNARVHVHAPADGHTCTNQQPSTD
jgi:hypothetical protein